MALIPYVLLTTTDASGGDVTVTAYRQPRIDPPPATDYAPPATVSPRQWTPALDESSIAPLVERVVDGRVTKAIAPTADVTFRLVSYLVDGVQTWPIAAGRIWHGQPCEVGYVGVDGSGNTWTMDAPLIIASGEAASSTDDRGLTGLEITVRSHPDLWATSVPARTWLGYQGGVLCDGATSSGPTGYATVPTAFTWQALILLPLVWDYGGAGRAPLVTHASGRWYADALGDGFSWRFCFEYWDGVGFQTIVGASYTGDERFHWIDVTVNLAAGGGGVSATFGVDGAETTATNATAFSAAAGSWLLFNQTAYYLSTIIGAIAFFNVAKTRAELNDLQSSRLIGDETGLTLYYPGPLTATKLLDNTLANYGSPYDVTVVGGVHRTLLEGAAPLAGTRPTLIYRGLQMPPTPVDVANRVYSFGQDCELIESANARGADWPITWYDNIRACLAAAPAAGTVAACSFGGIMKIGSGDALELAANVRGVGGNDDAPWSLALGSDYGSGNVGFASWNALMAGLTAWTLDIRFSTIVDPAVNYQTVFNSGFVWVAIFSAIATGIRPLIYVNLSTTAGSVALFADFPVDTTVDFRVEAWNSGGDAFMRIMVNGSLATLEGGTSGYATVVTDTIKTAALGPSPTLSAGVGNESIYLGVLPMRFWDTATTGTDAAATAAAEASCRKFLFRDPVNGTDAEYANLVSLWHGPLGGTPATVEDLVGTNDGAITGTPHWRPPLAFDNPVPAAVYTLETLGGYPLPSIDISDSAYSTYGAQTLWVEGGAKSEDSGFKSVAEVLDLAMGAGYALLHGNGTVTLGAVLAATAGNAVGTITADEVYEISPRRLQPSGSPGFAGPPSVIEYTYGRSGLVSDPLATAPEDIAAQISRDVGRDQVPVSSWGLYGDAGKERTLVLPGTYLLRTRAKAAADDAATTWAPLRPVMVVKLKGEYLTDYNGGDIVGVWDYRANTTIYVMILQPTRRQRQAGGPGDEWEVA